MQQFIEYIVKNLVDQPDSVSVQSFEGQKGTIVEIRVAKDDVGKVVGKSGKTIKALRTITNLVGTRIDRKVRLEIVE